MATNVAAFPLMMPNRNPIFHMMVRLIALCAIIGALGAWAAHSAHAITLNQTWFYIGVAAASPTILSALFFWQMTGVVELSSAGITLRSRAWKGFYGWADVAGVDMATPESQGRFARLLTALTAVQVTPHVAVKLRRVPRTSLIANRDGTDVTVGFPRLLTKSLELYVADPDGFVNAARQHLAA